MLATDCAVRPSNSGGNISDRSTFVIDLIRLRHTCWVVPPIERIVTAGTDANLLFSTRGTKGVPWFCLCPSF